MTGANRHYVLAAGGTGGHLLPAFALATELERRGHHVALITDARGAQIPGKPDFLPAHVLPAGRFGKNPLSWIKGLRAVLEGRRMALRLFDSFEPSAVVGFGGYPSLPAILAATSAGVPTVVHEQNAVLGRVNRLFARGPRFRLPAEMIRDHALAASGLLVGRLGGESVRPYQPPGLWDDVVYENVPRFVQDHGGKLYRRSMYTYWKRSVPPPNMQAFDAPSREVCVLTRAFSR